MNLPGSGSCSAILHLFASYPKVMLAGSVATVTAMLISPIGPGIHSGSEDILQKVDQRLAEIRGVKEDYDLAYTAYQQVQGYPLTDGEIKSITAYLCECDTLTPANIRKDPKLYQEISLLLFLDVTHKQGLSKAKQLFASRATEH
jgi:hypothetical protein